MDIKRNAQSSPKKITPALSNIVSYLSLDPSTVIRLKYHRSEFDAEIDNCHLNVWIHIDLCGGEPQHGWILSEYTPANFAEAQFHAVWRSPDKILKDITPRSNKEKRILFIPDNERSISLTEHDDAPALYTYDNIRIQNGVLLNGLERIKIVPQGDMIYRYGLAVRT